MVAADHAEAEHGAAQRCDRSVATALLGYPPCRDATAPGLVLSPTASVGADVVFGANVVVHDGVVIGDGVTIQDGAVLGKPPRSAPRSTAPRGGAPSRS